MKFLSLFTSSVIGLLLLFSVGCSKPQDTEEAHLHTVQVQDTLQAKAYPVMKTDAEWKRILTSSQYRVLRKGSTELPFINEYNKNKEEGIHVRGAC